MLSNTNRFRAAIQCAAAFSIVVSTPILANAQQTVYVSNLVGNSISEYSSTGAYLGSITAGLDEPVGMAINVSGDLFAANIGNNTLTEYSPNGSYLGLFASTGLSDPQGVAFDKSGNVYAGNLNTVTEYSPTGAYLGTFTPTPWAAISLAFASNGDLYVSNDPGNPSGGVTYYSANGTYLGTFGAGLNDRGLAIDAAGNVYVARGSTNSILEFSPNGTSLGTFATGLDDPCGIAFDSSGNLYAASNGDNTITEFSSSGANLGVFTDTNLDSPFGIAFSSQSPTGTPEPSAFVAFGIGALVFARKRFWRKRVAK